MHNPFQNVVDNDDTETKSVDHKVIDRFSGAYEYLSNFFMRHVTIDIECLDENGEMITYSETFPSNEHAFQACKTLDRDVQKVIRDAPNPRKAKKLGRKARMRSDWEDIKVDVMERVVFAKFSQHIDLKMRLLLTGDAELIEGNTWNDDFWGVTQYGVGKNHLGKILMRVRQQLQESEGDFEVVFKGFLNQHNLEFLFDRFNLEPNDEQENEY